MVLMASAPESKSEHTPGDPEEFRIFVERFMQFMNLWTVYDDFLTGKYVPTIKASNLPEEWSITDMGPTLMFVLFGFFYSLIEDADNALNGFRIWRQRFPDEERAITAVESEVAHFSNDLKVFRNRLAFHGSRSRNHQSNGFDFFVKHSGNETWEGVKNFKSLGAALLAKDCARQGLKGYDKEQVRHWIDSVAEKSRRASQAS